MKATDEIKREIEFHLPKGKTIESVRTELMKEAKKDGSSAHLSFPGGGFRLFYTTNPNFANGVKNGYGPGLYASLNRGGMFSTVKL